MPLQNEQGEDAQLHNAILAEGDDNAAVAGSEYGCVSMVQAVVRSTSHNHTPLLDRRDHSALMLAARMTLPHFSVSSAMSLPKSAGEP